MVTVKKRMMLIEAMAECRVFLSHSSGVQIDIILDESQKGM